MALSNAEKQARHRVARKGIAPEQCDIDQVDAQYGALPRGASVEDQAKRWRDYQAQALIRLWQAGELPPDQMRRMDEIARGQKDA
jgi:hypothetical protein